jgi:hypothetical protein
VCFNSETHPFEKLNNRASALCGDPGFWALSQAGIGGLYCGSYLAKSQEFNAIKKPFCVLGRVFLRVSSTNSYVKNLN